VDRRLPPLGEQEVKQVDSSSEQVRLTEQEALANLRTVPNCALPGK
jgi:hypothetical protein